MTRTPPCAVKEAWIDPTLIPAADQATEMIGEALQQQYMKLQGRSVARFTVEFLLLFDSVDILYVFTNNLGPVCQEIRSASGKIPLQNAPCPASRKNLRKPSISCPPLLLALYIFCQSSFETREECLLENFCGLIFLNVVGFCRVSVRSKRVQRLVVLPPV